MNGSTTHACAVCERQVPAGKLMCLMHWKLVPHEQQRAVYRGWARYQHSSGGMGSRLQALRLYNAARDAAVASAQAALGQSTTTGAP